MVEEAPICEHFQRAAELIGKRWNPQVVRALQTGSARFGDLKHAVPNISDAVLSERLKELEAEGIVTRDVTPSTPVLIEYHLTDRGRDLTKVMEELAAWAERWAGAEPVGMSSS
ncbi:MAG TPA: helix-turn-helix domain-containing protein [Actinomycetota bacterium]|nr:helix-turn-helix domain-containing protein [Actinomycetota bacterium]